MYVEHARAVSRPLSLASVRRARWSISSSLLESHLIRSQRDLIEHSAAVCAPGPAERGARPRRERAPPPHKRFFLLPPVSSDSFEFFPLSLLLEFSYPSVFRMD